jgi:hypothetical protein
MCHRSINRVETWTTLRSGRFVNPSYHQNLLVLPRLESFIENQKNFASYRSSRYYIAFGTYFDEQSSEGQAFCWGARSRPAALLRCSTRSSAKLFICNTLDRLEYLGCFSHKSILSFPTHHRRSIAPIFLLTLWPVEEVSLALINDACTTYHFGCVVHFHFGSVAKAKL